MPVSGGRDSVSSGARAFRWFTWRPTWVGGAWACGLVLPRQGKSCGGLLAVGGDGRPAARIFRCSIPHIAQFYSLISEISMQSQRHCIRLPQPETRCFFAS